MSSLLRAIVLLMCSSAMAADAIPDDFVRRAMKLESHWNLFIRRLAGCPDQGSVNELVCTLSKKIDYAEYSEARKAAIALFDLKER